VARGPKPKPAAIKRQRASSGRPVVEDALPVAPVSAGAIAAPTWLKDEALEIWNGRAAALTNAKLLTEADATAFGRYCRNLARWLKMQKALDETTEIYSVTTASGTVHRPRPEFLIADRLERQLLAIEDRFGLNPSERQRIFAARANSGGTGDLFDAPARPGDPAAKPTEPARPIEGPIGLLN
jgi:P27 family predicted phage terminase small subunit